MINQELTINGLNNNSDPKTIVFTHGGGRFGNQMFSYAQLLAFTMEHHNIDIINVSFWEYADLLEASRKDFLCTKKLDLRKNRLFRWLFIFCKYTYIKNDSIAKRFIICLMYLYGCNPFSKYYSAQSISTTKGEFLTAEVVENFDLANLESFCIVSKKKTTFLSGWEICNWKLVEKHQHEIRSFLQIRKKYVDISDFFIAEKRKKYNFLIGIMIRQGDYQYYQNGRHYFSTQQYSSWIEELSKIFEDQGKVGFVIASDAPQSLHNFSNQNIYFTTGIAGGEGHYIESLLELSSCDVIASVPSTFSMWAAFVGDIPIMPLISIDKILTKDSLLTNNLFDYVSFEC